MHHHKGHPAHCLPLTGLLRDGGIGPAVSGVAEGGLVEEVEGEAGETGTLRLTLWKHIIIIV